MSVQNEMILVESKPPVPLFDRGPKEMVAGAAEIAGELTAIIKTKGLYNMIQGKPHVRLEGWTTMGSLLGIVPVEKECRELPDGSYEASVDLIRMRDGMRVGGASALCGVEEKRWGKADRYARRSMAVTRATSKAYRLGFSWIMVLPGYEATPVEEMPVDLVQTDEKAQAPSVYEGKPDQKVRLFQRMKAAGITNKEIMKQVHDACMGQVYEVSERMIEDAIKLRKELVNAAT